MPIVSLHQEKFSINSDLSRNTIKYKNKHKYRDAAEIILHFINVKYWNILTNRNGNKLARVMVAYHWEEMWELHASEIPYNEVEGPFYYWTIKENHKQ